MYLHSNLVIFKFKVDYNKYYIGAKFTFQSGDIQILIQKLKNALILTIYIPIWWYSNKYLLRRIVQSLLYLHSNLVIFKYNLLEEISENIKKFTFQSGDIQMLSILQTWKKYLHVHANLVIFKSLQYKKIENSHKGIYIPIWWYSNSIGEPQAILPTRFTFQSGDIQILFLHF